MNQIILLYRISIASEISPEWDIPLRWDIPPHMKRPLEETGSKYPILKWRVGAFLRWDPYPIYFSPSNSMRLPSFLLVSHNAPKLWHELGKNGTEYLILTLALKGIFEMGVPTLSFSVHQTDMINVILIPRCMQISKNAQKL